MSGHRLPSLLTTKTSVFSYQVQSLRGDRMHRPLMQCLISNTLARLGGALPRLSCSTQCPRIGGQRVIGWPHATCLPRYGNNGSGQGWDRRSWAGGGLGGHTGWIGLSW